MSQNSGQPGSSSGHGQLLGSTDSGLLDTTAENALRAMSLADQQTFFETDENFRIPGQQLLNKYMSFRSVISTRSSLAKRNTQADPDQTWRSIGKGTQGVIFEQPGSTYCWKLQLKGGNDQLWNNYVKQSEAREAFENVAKDRPELVVDVKCPVVGGYVRADDKVFWDEAKDRLEWAASGWDD